MTLPKRPLGDYWQLLDREGLLSAGAAMPGQALERPVELVTCDSQEVVPGTLFIVKGVHFKGEYLADAVKKGAFAYIAQEPWPEGAGAACISVRDVRRAMGLLADAYYDSPSQKLSVVGITGTKGKSSTAYYLKYIFDAYLEQTGQGGESGIISSIDTFDGVERFESHLTTPEPLALQHHLANAAEAGLPYLTMEVSSQGLKYDRMVGVRLAAAVFLNIGYDHISPIEHPDVEDYFRSKLKIFDHSRLACVNLDGERTGEVLAAARRCDRVITFSQRDENADVFAKEVRKEEGDIVFRVRTPRFRRELRLTMPGLFNVENALAAIAVCEGLGIPERCVTVGLMKARVPGRMEVYASADSTVTAIVDYAHNRLSFEKLFASVKEEYPEARVVIVFGCPGHKAIDRRHDLGEIAGHCAGLTIITEEDPGEEEVVDISREVAAAVAAAGGDYVIEPDRGEAIRTAIMGAQGPTVVLITGKGAETRQKRGTQYVPVISDVEYTKRYLKEYDLSHGLDAMDKVRHLLDILPVLKSYEGKTVVVKYGGSALGEDGAVDSILRDVATLRQVGARVTLVHGGGKAITRLIGRLGLETRFEGGYRVTDEASLEAAEMALSAQVNKSIVHALGKVGVRGVGISGRDGGTLRATVKDPALGRVGKVQHVDTRLLKCLLDQNFLPVLSPVAFDEQGGLNCNADDVAAVVAQALGADQLIYLTDVEGVLTDPMNPDTRVRRLTVRRGEELLRDGLIAGGMAPKVASSIHAVEQGVGEVLILDGKRDHALLLEAVSQRSQGTRIVP